MLPHTTIIIVALATLTSATFMSPYSKCNCGLDSGEDVCHDKHEKHKCTPLVVRPIELPKPPSPEAPKVVCAPVVSGVPPLTPLGGPCTCHTSLVKPAHVPRPACNTCCGKLDVYNEHQLTTSQKHQILFGGNCGCHKEHPRTRPIFVDEVVHQPTNPAHYIPADPVSLSLAYKLAQESCHHDEDKLSFGFRCMPKEMPMYTKKRVNNIPEEDLFSLNGQIVELKKIKCAGKSVDEEAAEQLLELANEEEEDKVVADQFKKVSLGEIGYGPAKIKPAHFINVPVANPVEALEDSLADNLKGCNDGFKPGNVLIKQIPKYEPISLPVPLPEPCGSSDEIPVMPPLPHSTCCNPYTYLSHSSSANCANKCSQTVFLQKLGYDDC